jgi:hypothetical protein
MDRNKLVNHLPPMAVIDVTIQGYGHSVLFRIHDTVNSVAKSTENVVGGRFSFSLSAAGGGTVQTCKQCVMALPMGSTE